MRERPKLGEVLISAGVLSPGQLQEVLERQAQTRGRRPRLGSLIVELGYATEEDLALALASQFGLEYVELGRIEPDPFLAEKIPRRLSEHHGLVAIREEKDSLILAMFDPANVVGIDDVRMATGIADIQVVVSTISSINAAIRRAYGLDSDREASTTPFDIEADLDESVSPATDDDLDTVRREIDAAPIVQLVTNILSDAVRSRATDIHIEPQPLDLRLRYRVDGVMREATTLPKRVQAPVLSRIKILSGMDISERRRPQDGRGRIRVEGRTLDTRVSTIPTPFGEKAVIRLLPEGQEFVPLEELGLEDDQLKTVLRFLDIPQGLLIFTGPTGSGKTTSMYAALDRLKSPEINLVTLEDPIEYQLTGVNQVQIDERTGITFARGLRSVLRQDPDVILVGEIRDVETARIVMQASMTGHLVFSTLHTNDAPSAIIRLNDLGLESFLVASSLSLIVAQRLIRTVCDRCQEPASPSDHVLHVLGLTRGHVEEANIVAGSGCESCGYTGYRGRTGIFEVVGVSRTMRELIGKQASINMLSVAARAEGMRSLRNVGIRKALAGITTLDEVIRVTYLEHDEGPKCPNCSGDVDPSFAICPFCRTSLTAKGCSNCGKATQPDWLACAYCGTVLQTPVPAGRKSARILLVDDDRDINQLIKTMLEPEYEVIAVEAGAEGVEKAASIQPDAILLDLLLPDISGLEVLRELRREGRNTEAIPIVMMTAAGDEASEVDCLYAGVDDFLRKPFREELLRARIASVLRRTPEPLNR